MMKYRITRGNFLNGMAVGLQADATI